MNDAVKRIRDRVDRRLGEPDRLRFPKGWTYSTSWQRAQSSDHVTGPVNPAEWDVLLGSGDCHRVAFYIYEDAVRVGCECDGYRFRNWCAHVAFLWWRWVRHDLVVADLDTGRRHTAPPDWLTVEDAEHNAPSIEANEPEMVRADGGPRVHAKSAHGRELGEASTGGCNTFTGDRGKSHDGSGNTPTSSEYYGGRL